MPAWPTIRSFLELARLSNAPTCISNVLVGCAAAIVVTDEPLPWDLFLLTSGAVLLLYVAGMALNDVVDLEFDLAHRPDRPIPSGRITRAHAIAFVIIAILGAWALIGLALFLELPRPAAPHVIPIAIALTGCILLYDALHKKSPAAVVLMGLCRGLVYVLAAVMIEWPADSVPLLIFALTTTIYIIVLTLIARSEHKSETRRGPLPLALPVIVLLPVIWIHPSWWGWALAAAALAIIWILRSSMHLRGQPPSPPRAVMGWLAGICLIDAWYLTLLPNSAPLALIALGCFVMTVLAQQRILGS